MGDPMEFEKDSVIPVSRRKVAYYYDDDIGTYAYNLVHPMKPHRIKMAHNLIINYGLDQKMDVMVSLNLVLSTKIWYHCRTKNRASPFEMTKFHTDEYIEFLQQVTGENILQLSGDQTRYLIGEDCPAFEGLFEFCSISAGGSIASAKRLNDGLADIAINWAGGLHHAKKREASGFCYVNDIILAILEFLKYNARVLYIDIDIHHGDGVEEAFYSTDRVMSCSFHKFGDYFPGTGDLGDRGIGKGKGYAVNVPLRDGIDDTTYRSVFRPIIQTIIDWYRPGAIVLQCGADSLAEDKLGCFNLSMKGHADCVKFVRSFNIPMIILGGGGYTIRNVARTWAFETGLACGEELDLMLPFNEYMEYYGPEFKLDVPNNNMDNQNSREYLEGIKISVIENLRHLPFAPSAAMMPIPQDPADDDVESDNDLDVRIAQRQRNARISRYGDTLSDSEDDLPKSLRGSKIVSHDSNGISDHDHGTRRHRKKTKHFDEDAPLESLASTKFNGKEKGDLNQPLRVKRTFFRLNPEVGTSLPPLSSLSRASAVLARSKSIGGGFSGMETETRPITNGYH